MKISILGLAKPLVLEALYDGALYKAEKFDAQPAIREKAISGKVSSPIVKRMLANQFIKERNQSSRFPNYQFGTIDLGAGPRELAVDLSGFEIDVSEYDELHGEGAAQKIISKLYGEKPQNQKESKVKAIGEEKNLFYTAIQDNADWLQPILPEMVTLSAKQGKKSEDFVTDLDRIISKHEVQVKYEKKSEQAIYLTWIKLLDPKINQQTKENLCSELAKRYTDDQGDQAHKISIGGTLSYLPPIITATILLYAPLKVISAYRDYQDKYGKYNQEFRDKNFETTLKFLLNNKLFSKQAKTIFLTKLMEMLKQRAQQSYFRQDDTDYLLHEAMASWEKNSLTALVSEHFNEELSAEYNKFKEKLDETMKNPESRLMLSSELGSLVFEKWLVECKSNVEILTPIVMRFHNDKDMQTLARIYTAHGLNPVEVFKQHLVQLAKATNEPDHYQFSSLFFSECLKYLQENQAKSIAPKIAEFLSAKYYAKESYPFDTIRKEMFTFWIEHKPEQITAIVKAILESPKKYHETPIDKFFSDLSYVKMPASFYDKLAHLLIDKLTPVEFIQVYTATSEEVQHKFLSVMLSDEVNALSKLKKIADVYKTGDFSAVFSRKISSQLKTINPEFHKKAEIEKLFAVEEVKDDLETDLLLLKKILENEAFTHNERRTEMRRLNNLHSALGDEKIDTCPVVIKMFNAVPQKHWPDLFVYFDAETIHWSFPQDERHLELFYPDKEKRPPPRKNTWLSHQEEWEKVLYGTLVATLADLSRKELRGDVAHWALSSLDQAFTKCAEYFPDRVDKVLKKFFLENFPNSIKIFTAMQDKFRDKYHAPKYFSREGIYDQVASWLSEDIEERTIQLLRLVRVENEGFEPALKSPFIRNKQELEYTLSALITIKTKPEHIVNLFERLSRNINNTLFKNLYQMNEERFLKLLQRAFSDIGKANLFTSHYMRLATMLLSYSENANIDIFKIIDADPNKDFFLKAVINIETWQMMTSAYPNRLIFKIAHHYQPEQLLKVVFDHIQKNIEKNDLFSLCQCIKAAKKVIQGKLVLPQPEEKILVDYLIQKMPEALDSPYSEVEVMADFIPNFDKLFLGLMAKEIVIQDELSYKQKNCLDNLVEVYGFAHINALCLEFKLVDHSAYLVEKFSKFPEILKQTEEAVDLYANILEGYQDKVDDATLWRFYNNLREIIMKTAKESTTEFEVNVAEVGFKAGMTPELAGLMPTLKITNVTAKKVPDAKPLEEPFQVKASEATSSEVTPSEVQPSEVKASEVKSLTGHFGLHKKRKRDQMSEEESYCGFERGFLLGKRF